MSDNDQSYSPGLAGVIAGETTIACVDQGVLLYRGYPIEQLAYIAPFAEVTHLLLFGVLPNSPQLRDLHRTIYQYSSPAPKLTDAPRHLT